MLIAATIAQLDQTQPIAAWMKTHRLGIDGDRTRAEQCLAGQVFFVEIDGHSLSRTLSREPA